MKRSVLVLFLLLVPLTLAPRTAFTPVDPEDGEVVVQARLPQREVPVGSAVTVAVRVTNAAAEMTPTLRLATSGDQSRILSASRGCTVDGLTVTCEPVEDGEQRTVRVTVRVLDLGEHVAWMEGQLDPLGSFNVIGRGKSPARR